MVRMADNAQISPAQAQRKPAQSAAEADAQSLAATKAVVSRMTRAGLRRQKGWRAKWLEAYAKTGNVTAASQAVGVHRDSAQKVLRQNAAFAAAAAQAREQARELMEAHLQRLGVVGEPVNVWMQSRADGRPIKVDTIYKKSVPALLRWLEANWPEKYGQHITQEHTGPGGTPLAQQVIAPIVQVNIPSNGRGDSQLELEQRQRALLDAQADASQAED